MAMQDTVKELRRPLAPESVRFKLQTNPKSKPGGAGFTKGMAIAYIDARAVVSRLNDVCPGEWEDRYVTPPPPLGTGLECRLKVQGVIRTDIGFSSDLVSDMGVKALYSNAFKRAAVKFEVGAFLYAMPRMYVDANELTQRQKDGKTVWFMPNRTVNRLRGDYRKWLEDGGAKEFGPAASLGDAPDPQGDAEVPSDRVVDDDVQVPQAQDWPDFFRAAIRSKDKKRWADDQEWQLVVDGYRAGNDPEFGNRLQQEMTELGLDPAAVKQAWKERQS